MVKGLGMNHGKGSRQESMVKGQESLCLMTW